MLLQRVYNALASVLKRVYNALASVLKRVNNALASVLKRVYNALASATQLRCKRKIPYHFHWAKNTCCISNCAKYYLLHV